MQSWCNLYKTVHEDKIAHGCNFSPCKLIRIGWLITPLVWDEFQNDSLNCERTNGEEWSGGRLCWMYTVSSTEAYISKSKSLSKKFVAFATNYNSSAFILIELVYRFWQPCTEGTITSPSLPLLSLLFDSHIGRTFLFLVSRLLWLNL